MSLPNVIYVNALPFNLARSIQTTDTFKTIMGSSDNPSQLVKSSQNNGISRYIFSQKRTVSQNGISKDGPRLR